MQLALTISNDPLILYSFISVSSRPVACRGYDIDVRREDYFEARREWLKAVIMVFLAHDLPPTGDTIEDYGASYYFVRRIGKTWEEVTPA